MTVFRLLLSVYLIALWPVLATPIPTQEPSEPSFSLHINQQQVALKRPIIKRGSTIYIPIRDLSRSLNGQFKYSRKHRHYIFKQKNHPKSIIVVPDSATFWVNTTPHHFQSAPFHYQSRLYVPARRFFSALGYRVEWINQSLHVTTRTDQKAAVRPTYIAAQSAIQTPSQYRTIQPLSLPSLDSSRPFFIQIGSKSMDMSSRFFNRDSLPYVDIHSLLLTAGFTIDTTNEYLIYKKNQTTLKLPISGQKAIVTRYGQTTDVYINASPIYEKRWYIPLHLLQSVFNFYVHWDARTRILHLLTPIDSISFMRRGQSYVLSAHSEYNLTNTTIHPFSVKGGLSIDIDHSRLTRSDSSLKIDKSIYRYVQFSQLSPTKTRLTMFSDARSGALTIPTANGLDIVFYPVIFDIKQRVLYNDGAEVHIKSTGPMDFEYQVRANPPKVVVNFSNMDTSLPDVISAQSHYYSAIRSYRLERDGMASRIVIDLTTEATPNMHYDQVSHTLKLTFPPKPRQRGLLATRTPLPSAAPPTYKPSIPNKPSVSNKTSRYSGRSRGRKPLKNIRIVLDAGHGGSDPGAVGRYRALEKDYTLDITKRLTKQLQLAGATVIQARKFDQNPSLGARTQIANRSRANLFISIHVNSFFKDHANGTETYYYKWNDKKLARHLQKAMAKHLNLKDNGIKRAKLYVLHHSTIPAALVEPAFLTNRKESKLLRQSSFRQKIADSLFEGIQSYLK